MVLRKSFYIRWSAGRSPRVHEVNPGRDPSTTQCCDMRKGLNTEDLILQCRDITTQCCNIGLDMS